MSDNFKWNDELVKEFFYYKQISWPVLSLSERMEEFKKSKEKQLEWEILSFYSDMSDKRRNILTLQEDGTYRFGSDLIGVSVSLEDCLKRFDIHSVKRLSDGEVFTVNEIEGKWGEILKFKIEDNIMWAYFEYKPSDISCWTGLNRLVKVKPKEALFTTENGVEIFEGDEVFCVRKCDWLNSDSTFKAHLGSISLHINKENNAWWYFSTKDAANQFVLQNKPIQVTLKEITYAWEREDRYDYLHDFLKDFFKSKINP